MEVEGTMSHRQRLIGFRGRKAAQVAAFFTSQSGGTIDKLKLIKLIYLAERLFMEKYGQPMLYDELYSLPHGPICSCTLDAINGNYWSEYISRERNDVKITTEINDEVLDEISQAEKHILASIWESFGFMTPSQIRKYTHRNCPEYREVPAGSRLPIMYKDLLLAVGYDNAETMVDEINETRRIDALLSA